MRDHVGTEQFPILYENEEVCIYSNPAKELFVEHKGDRRCTLRISTYGRLGLLVTAHDCYLSPWSKNGLPAFGVIPKPSVLPV